MVTLHCGWLGDRDGVLILGWVCVCGEMFSSFQHLQLECTIRAGPTSEL